MQRKKEPKNKNITVRVTEYQYNEFTKIANSHDLSVSEWSNYIISEHKDDYRKRRNLDKLIHDTDLANLKTELTYRILEKFQIDNTILNGKRLPFEAARIRLAIKILDMTKFKSDDAIDNLIRNYHL